MMDSSENDGPRRAGPRPFVSGRSLPREEPRTFSHAPARPFSFSGARKRDASVTSTSSMSVARSQTSPTPLWTVAVYEPGLEREEESRVRSPQSETDALVDASLALADGVVEAQRHASSLAAAETLENVARRLRRGEILLLPGASTQTDAAVVSSVLAALLGGRR